MAENLDVLNTAVSLLIRAALLAARFSGRVRRRGLQRLAYRYVDPKAKEIPFLTNRVYQLEMLVSILQRQHTKRGKKPRYEVRERLLILWHMEAFHVLSAHPQNLNLRRRPATMGPGIRWVGRPPAGRACPGGSKASSRPSERRVRSHVCS